MVSLPLIGGLSLANSVGLLDFRAIVLFLILPRAPQYTIVSNTKYWRTNTCTGSIEKRTDKRTDNLLERQTELNTESYN